MSPPEIGADTEQQTEDEEVVETPPVEQDPVDLTVQRLLGKLVGLPVEQIVSQVWSALEAGKHVVLTGAPGTAKTTIALAVADVAVETDRCSTYLFTTATTDWTAMDTVGGYMPRRNGQGLRFHPGKFLECFRDEASKQQDFRWLVVAELNRAEVDKAFGQFFTVLSGHPCELPFRLGRKRIVIVPESWEDEAKRLYDPATSYIYRVPRKWRMLATLNTDDKASLFEMSYAFLRRFAFVHVPLPTLDGLDDICKIVLLPKPRSDELKSLWHAITTVRPLGPALFIDMAHYIRIRNFGTQEQWVSAVAEAIAMFVVPQCESLTPDDLLKLKGAITAENRDYWSPALNEAARAFLPAMADAIGSPRDKDGMNDGDDE